MAEEFLSQKGIEYDVYDVSKDRKAVKEMLKISNGARSVPVISICSEVVIGFDRDRVEQALNCLDQSPDI